MLSDWINPHYLDGNNEVITKPFPHSIFPDFFIEEKILAVLKALTEEKFFIKEADLFKFRQTHDFVNTKNNVLKEFYDFISSKEFITFISNVSQKKLSSHIDMFGTVYEDTDFLLCHDDKLEGRTLAYFVYLSNLQNGQGGELSLFGSDTKKIRPSFNTFAFFEVSGKSFHQVEEVINAQRIAITGWFHGE